MYTRGHAKDWRWTLTFIRLAASVFLCAPVPCKTTVAGIHARPSVLAGTTWAVVLYRQKGRWIYMYVLVYVGCRFFSKTKWRHIHITFLGSTDAFLYAWTCESYQTELHKMCEGNLKIVVRLLVKEKIGQGSLEFIVYVVCPQSRGD